MKKWLIAFGILFAALPARAALSGAPIGQGTNSYEIGQATGTTAILVVSGGGSLYNVVVATGAAGDFVVCYDSASALGYAAGGAASVPGTTTAPKLAQTTVAATNTTTGFPANVQPVYFANGLVCIKSVAGDNCQVHWR